MKQVKAFIHCGRVGDVARALNAASCRHLNVTDVRGTNEARLELVCQDDEVERFVQLIRQNGHTGQAIAGWIYVSAVELAVPIEKSTSHP